MNKFIGTIPKNTREVVKVELSEFNGHDLLSVRVWTKDTDRPTTKGLTVSVKLLPELLGALGAAEVEARKAGIL